MHPTRLIVSILLLASLARAGEMRSWTDRQNRTVEAAFLGMKGESAILKLKNGREVTYPLSKLSEADADYARKQSAGGKAEVAAPKLNFDEPWPDRIKFNEDPAIVTVEEDADKERFIYESANYRYVSDVRLSKSVVKGFAVMFEATYLFCRTLPLAIDGGQQTDGKLLIRLFEKHEDYVEAGGPQESAGVFMSGQAMVLVPLTSLGVRPVGSGYMFDRDKSSKTLPHELTHQLTPDPYFGPGSMGWFTEGIAEYVAVTPYRSGSFSVRGNHRDIIEYVTAYGSKNMGGRALGKEIRLPGLKSFMIQDYGRFMEQAQLNYGCSLLITYYFLQMDGDGDGKRIKNFLKALREGKTGDDALAVLLDGRSFEQLEKEFAKAWSRKGIDFTFGAEE